MSKQVNTDYLIKLLTEKATQYRVWTMDLRNLV